MTESPICLVLLKQLICRALARALREDREQDGRQNRYNGDDDKQLNKSKGGLTRRERFFRRT